MDARRVVLGALAALALWCVPVTASAAGTRPRPRPNSELIAYARGAPAAGAPSQIWVMDGDGRNVRQVTTPPAGASDSNPTLSSQFLNPIVWQRTTNGVSQILSGQLFALDPQDATVEASPVGAPLTSFAGGAFDPAFSPAQSSADLLIAFSVGGGGSCDLWVMAADGSHQRQLTDHGGQQGCDSSPTWSPDGMQIAFRRTTGDPAHPATDARLVIPVAGGSPTALAFGSAPVTGFSWGPGRDLLYLSPGPRAVRVQAVAANGSRRRLITSGTGIEGVPVWSPGGDFAAYARRESDGSTHIATVPGAGGTAVDLTHTPAIAERDPSVAYASVLGGLGGGAPGPGVHARSVRPGRAPRHRRHR